MDKYGTIKGYQLPVRVTTVTVVFGNETVVFGNWDGCIRTLVFGNYRTIFGNYEEQHQHYSRRSSTFHATTHLCLLPPPPPHPTPTNFREYEEHIFPEYNIVSEYDANIVSE